MFAGLFWGGQVDLTDARGIARDVMRPCGLLGSVIGRGVWWPSEAGRQRGKKAVASVLGDAWYLLTPIWKLHPSLDPASDGDELGLTGSAAPPEDSPASLHSLLDELEGALQRHLPTLANAFPDARGHILSMAKDTVTSIAQARVLVDELSAPGEHLQGDSNRHD